MEVMLHFNYVQAIAKGNPVWAEYTPPQLSLLSFMSLHLIWLKLLLPWRLFRLWALVDGVDPPENMVRCVSDNWSTLAFWRSWHRSFYRWSLRYIYVPLGGSSFRTARDTMRSILTYVLVFTFVALWHDIQMRLLIWGWLIVLFMLPEMAAGFLFPEKKWENRPETYRILTAVGAVINIFMMIAANLVGFSVGVEGLQDIIKGIFRNVSGEFTLNFPPSVCFTCFFFFRSGILTYYIGYVFMLGAYFAFYVGVRVMSEMRDWEMKRGINLKC